MNGIRRQLALVAAALAASVLIAACGGSDAEAPPDATPPTVGISTNVTGTASGPVTFTFVFSEDVGTSFNPDDVDLSAGATKGEFKRFTGTVSTLVVTPPPNARGTIQVNVQAGKFSDMEGNNNTLAASLQQAFDTTIPEPGNTGNCNAAPCIGFDAANVALTAFGGLGAVVANDPVSASNKVAKLVKNTAAETWAGATVDTSGNAAGTVDRIGFATSKIITLRVYSPAAGETIMLKVENSADSSVFMEKQVTTTKANAWETLSFDYASPSNGAYDASKAYNRISIFPRYGSKATAESTYYFDEVNYAKYTTPAEPGNTGNCNLAPCISFDAANIAFAQFGGMTASVASDPVSASNKVAKYVKSAAAETWAGATVDTSGSNAGTVDRIGFSTSKVVTLRVYSPAAGEKIMLKVENSADPTVYMEKEVATTKANAWETLSFDYASPSNGVYDANKAYNRVSIFPHFGTKVSADSTYYFDEVNYAKYTATAEPGNTGNCTAAPCIGFDAANLAFTQFGGMSAIVASDPVSASNKVAKFVKSAAAETWAGATIDPSGTGVGTVDRIGFPTSKIITMRVYSPAAGETIMLKVESSADPAVFMEKQVTTTKANAWETLSFDYASPSNGAYDASKAYNRISIFPRFGSKVTADSTYYFDEVNYAAYTGGGTANPIVFASGFRSNNRTVENGEWGLYSGNFTSYSNTYAGGGFVDQGVAAADSYVYLVVATSAPTTDGYMGIFTMAPGYTVAAPNAGVTLSGQANLKIELGMGAEWFQQAANKQLLVRTVGTQVYANGQGGFCQILIEKLVTPTTADLTTYTIALNTMTLAQPCNGGGFTSGVGSLAEALAKPIAEIHVQAVFPRVNTTVKAGAEYPTGFTRGSVSFE